MQFCMKPMPSYTLTHTHECNAMPCKENVEYGQFSCFANVMKLRMCTHCTNSKLNSKKKHQQQSTTHTWFSSWFRAMTANDLTTMYMYRCGCADRFKWECLEIVVCIFYYLSSSFSASLSNTLALAQRKSHHSNAKWFQLTHTHTLSWAWLELSSTLHDRYSQHWTHERNLQRRISQLWVCVCGEYLFFYSSARFRTNNTQ